MTAPRDAEKLAEEWADSQYEENDPIERACWIAAERAYLAGLHARDAEITAASLEIAELREAMKKVKAIENREFGFDYAEIEEARGIATRALARPTSQYAKLGEAYMALRDDVKALLPEVYYQDLSKALARVEALERGE